MKVLKAIQFRQRRFACRPSLFKFGGLSPTHRETVGRHVTIALEEALVGGFRFHIVAGVGTATKMSRSSANRSYRRKSSYAANAVQESDDSHGVCRCGYETGFDEEDDLVDND